MISTAGGNDFGWALRALKNGTPVTRLEWGGSIEVRLGTHHRVEQQTLLCVVADLSVPWTTCTPDDLLAEDWVLASDVKGAT